MDLVDQKQDEAVHNIIKVYLAQVNRALKISNIICEHSEEDHENILTGDHIICGLIYRLMVPMTDEDMNESFNTADEILDGINDSSESDDSSLTLSNISSAILNDSFISSSVIGTINL